MGGSCPHHPPPPSLLLRPCMEFNSGHPSLPSALAWTTSTNEWPRMTHDMLMTRIPFRHGIPPSACLVPRILGRLREMAKHSSSLMRKSANHNKTKRKLIIMALNKYTLTFCCSHLLQVIILSTLPFLLLFFPIPPSHSLFFMWSPAHFLLLIVLFSSSSSFSFYSFFSFFFSIYPLLLLND